MFLFDLVLILIIAQNGCGLQWENGCWIGKVGRGCFGDIYSTDSRFRVSVYMVRDDMVVLYKSDVLWYYNIVLVGETSTYITRKVGDDGCQGTMNWIH